MLPKAQSNWHFTVTFPCELFLIEAKAALFTDSALMPGGRRTFTSPKFARTASEASSAKTAPEKSSVSEPNEMPYPQAWTVLPEKHSASDAKV